MNNVVYTFLLITGLIFSPASQADQWTVSSPVELIYQYTNGSVFIRLVDQHNDPNSYGCSTQHYFLLDKASSNFDIVYTALLAAQHSGREMRVALDGCTSGGWPLIKHAQSR